MERDGVQTIEKVAAEASALNTFLQMLVGRRNYPYIELDGRAPADTLDYLILQKSEQFDLEAMG